MIILGFKLPHCKIIYFLRFVRNARAMCEQGISAQKLKCISLTIKSPKSLFYRQHVEKALQCQITRRSILVGRLVVNMKKLFFTTSGGPDSFGSDCRQDKVGRYLLVYRAWFRASVSNGLWNEGIGMRDFGTVPCRHKGSPLRPIKPSATLYARPSRFVLTEPLNSDSNFQI